MGCEGKWEYKVEEVVCMNKVGVDLRILSSWGMQWHYRNINDY